MRLGCVLGGYRGDLPGFTFFGIAAGGGQPWSIIGFWIGVVLAWSWVSAMAGRLMAGAAAANC